VRTERERQNLGAFLLRVLLGSLFIVHLYWKLAVLPGGLPAWWNGILRSGYPAVVPAYVLSAEVMGALLLIPGIFPRLVALYAIPMKSLTTQGLSAAAPGGLLGFATRSTAIAKATFTATYRR